MNSENIPVIKDQLKAIAGSVAVITADINTLTAEMETIQLDAYTNCDAKGGKHVDNNSPNIREEKSPDKSLIHKSTIHCGSKAKCRPMINGMIPSVNCLADAVKSNCDQDYTDRLFSEVMETEGFHEDFLVNTFDYLNEHLVLARAFITLRPHLRKEFLRKLASKLLVNGSTQMFGISYIEQGAFGRQGMGSRLVAFTPIEINDSSRCSFMHMRLQSISGMPVYSDKNHEKLRWEDYQMEKIFGTTGI